MKPLMMVVELNTTDGCVVVRLPEGIYEEEITSIKIGDSTYIKHGER